MVSRIAEIELKSSHRETLISIRIDLYEIESYETEHEIIKLFSDITEIASRVYPGSRVSLNSVAKRIVEGSRAVHGLVLGSDIKPTPKRKKFSGKRKWKW